MKSSEAKRLKEIEQENARIKQPSAWQRQQHLGDELDRLTFAKRAVASTLSRIPCPRAPPRPPPSSRPQGSAPQRDPGVVFEPDPEFLEHTRREQFEQPDLPWES